MDEVKTKIIEGALDLWREKGAGFTMDELAERLSMSKKTIYIIIPDKQTLFSEMIDYTFDAIKRSEDEIMSREGLSADERLRAILKEVPDRADGIDFTRIYGMRDKYPDVCRLFEERMQAEWDRIFSLLDLGMKEGCFRPVDVHVFHMIYKAAMERFLNDERFRETFVDTGAVRQELADLLLDGIRTRVNE